MSWDVLDRWGAGRGVGADSAMDRIQPPSSPEPFPETHLKYVKKGENAA